jgi:Protein of unknown function (DUF4239)
MSPMWFWGILLIGGTVILSVAGSLLVRRFIPVEALERHNEVAGFIYAVIGVVYAVLLGFAAITVWERYDKAQAGVEQEANDLADLYRDAETFPDDVRAALEAQIRTYAHLVIEKEWPAMTEHRASAEAWEAYTRLWRAFYQIQPESEHDKIWYAQSITRLNDLDDQRRVRLVESRAGGVPEIMWLVLVGTSAITIAFSYLFGTKNATAQLVMSAGLALTIALVMLAIVALADITRTESRGLVSQQGAWGKSPTKEIARNQFDSATF